ncbi:NHL repeat-containing protein [Pedobacter sp. BAL39]|uniref:NHL repeat-containing protein n=1 Tax=Pedobacter sp. BAL39 TaxID=391596 RepID=UPI0005874FC3|nr:NHL repeat-containing protein [Pedobacter sp. BAL39]
MKSYLSVLTAMLLIFCFSRCEKTEDPNVDPVEEVVPDTLPTPITDLDRPIGLTVSKGKYGNRIIISWTAIPLAKNYKLFKFDGVKDEYVLLKETADTTFTDLASTFPLEKVFYKVMVYNSATAYSRFSDVDYGYTTGKTYSKAFHFGSEGTGPGQFEFGMHVETDGAGNIYVCDDVGNRVQKFDANGNFKEIFFTGSGARAVAFLNDGSSIVTRTQSSSYVLKRDAQKNVIKEWGTYGTGVGQFRNIEEITLDDDENIYIVDGQNNAVKKYDKNGNYILQFTAAVKTDEQIDGPYPYGICYLNDKIFVTSPRNSQVRVYDKSGNFLKFWNAGSVVNAIKAKNNKLYLCCSGFVMKTDENGEVREEIGRGEFTGQIPGLAVNNNEDVIVSDIYARRILVFKQL